MNDKYWVMNKLEPKQNNFILYTTPEGEVKLNVLLEHETIWLTQKMMADLFGVGVPAINKHLSNIFESNELEQDSVISILETTASDGKNYKTKFYNLDAVISVGYRVNSSKATPLVIALNHKEVLNSEFGLLKRLRNILLKALY